MKPIKTKGFGNLSVGKVVDPKQFIKDIRQLPEQIRGELMTAAEQFQAMGEEKGLEKGLKEGLEKGREEVAINLLKEGTDPQFVARIAKLEFAVILKLQAQLEQL